MISTRWAYTTRTRRPTTLRHIDHTVRRYGIDADALARKVADEVARKAAVANPASTRTAEAVAGDDVVVLKSRAEAPEQSVDPIRECLERFLERQCRSVTVAMTAGARKSRRKDAGDDLPLWWDAARWNRELADDLEPLFRTVCDLRGSAAMADIGEPPESWDSARTANFVRAMAERRADLFNETTYEELAASLMEFEEGDPGRITAAERAFLDHAANRAARGARTFATACAGFATKEAVRQRYPKDTDRIRRTKTWRHHRSDSPRSSHAAMDGETVGLDERFSNGADYPGDLALPAKEAVNCHCTMEVGVEKGNFVRASLNYFTQDDELRKRVPLMKPEPGYEDFEDVGIHSDGMTFGYHHQGGVGEDGLPRENTEDDIPMTPAELAESLADNPD